MQEHIIHHTCHVSFHPIPLRAPWCKNTQHAWQKMRSAQPTQLRAPWCKEHTIYNAEHTSLQPTTLSSPWCKSIQYTTPAMHPSTRPRWGQLDTRTHSMCYTKCVPCTRHRISSALFCQPTPVYRPTRNFYKTLVSDDWLGIIIVQLAWFFRLVLPPLTSRYVLLEGRRVGRSPSIRRFLQSGVLDLALNTLELLLKAQSTINSWKSKNCEGFYLSFVWISLLLERLFIVIINIIYKS